MSPRQISLSLQNSQKKRFKRIGDTVALKTPPHNYVPYPKPIIMDLRKNGNSVDIQIKYYIDSGRYSSAPTLGVFKSKDLYVEDMIFQIGDRVIVTQKTPLVLVPENTSGVIVGGAGDDYRVSFQYMCDGKKLEVNQNGVPQQCLGFVSAAPTDIGVEESSSFSDEEGDEEDEEGDEEDDDEGEDDEEDDVSQFNMTLQTPELKQYLVDQLNETITELFSNYMDAQEDEVFVESVEELDAILQHFRDSVNLIENN